MSDLRERLKRTYFDSWLKWSEKNSGFTAGNIPVTDLVALFKENEELEQQLNEATNFILELQEQQET